MKIYCDLDGVLADFNSRIFSIFGKKPNDIEPSTLWSTLHKYPNFFTELPWTIDGEELWSSIKKYHPIILTGVPRGKGAEVQKIKWCKKHLGINTKVITCWSYEKYKYCQEGDVLIDDRASARYSWETVGGTFILHKNTKDTINELETILR